MVNGQPFTVNWREIYCSELLNQFPRDVSDFRDDVIQEAESDVVKLLTEMDFKQVEVSCGCLFSLFCAPVSQPPLLFIFSSSSLLSLLSSSFLF